MKNILITCAENTDFNKLFKILEKFPCIITFDNCGGSFNSIFSGNLQVVCRQEDYSEIQKILAKFVWLFLIVHFIHSKKSGDESRHFSTIYLDVIRLN